MNTLRATNPGAVYPLFDMARQVVGSLSVPDAIVHASGRRDIIQRVVLWQQAKARQGTHSAKGMGDVSGTTKKPYKQKGTGNARQGSLRAPQFRGGGIVHGPMPRDHSYGLPKKVRKLGLLHALGSKLREGRVSFLKDAKAESHKTREMVRYFRALDVKSALVVDSDIDVNFARAIRNIQGIDVLPPVGANVRDILAHEWLFITLDGATALWKRLGLDIDSPWTDSSRSGQLKAARERRMDEAQSTGSPARNPRSQPPLNSASTSGLNLFHVVSSLRSPDPAVRRRTVMEFRSPLPPGLPRNEYAAELLPMVASGAEDGAEAAMALCHLIRPDSYRDLSPDQELRQARFDLPEILKEEGVEVVAYVSWNADGMTDSEDGRRVRVVARLSEVLPVKLGGEYVRLLVNGETRNKPVTCEVSGRSVLERTPSKLIPELLSGDIGAVAMECTVAAGVPQPVTVDVFLGDRWIERRDLSI